MTTITNKIINNIISNNAHNPTYNALASLNKIVNVYYSVKHATQSK